MYEKVHELVGIKLNVTHTLNAANVSVLVLYYQSMEAILWVGGMLENSLQWTMEETSSHYYLTEIVLGTIKLEKI